MKVVNVSNGDYKLIVQSGGEITFNTGSQTGLVRITGDLLVEGNTTTVQSETMTVRDNIIVVNAGETGNGVSLTTSGITVDRGNFSDASILFDESVSHRNASGSATNGTFTFVNDTNALVGIQTCSINTRGENLYLINAPGDGYVTVTGTSNYETNMLSYSAYWPTYPSGTPTYSGPITIVEDDAIPNMKAVSDFLTSGLYFFDDWRIIESNTSVSVYDSAGGNIYRPSGYTPPATSNISFTVDGNERGKFTPVGLDVDNINIYTNTINNSSANLVLTSTAANNIVEIDAVIQLDDTGLSPTAISGATKIYTVNSDTTPAPGKTGIYFTSLGNSDELVAKNRALLFSILF
jgi:hypothetical protein